MTDTTRKLLAYGLPVSVIIAIYMLYDRLAEPAIIKHWPVEARTAALSVVLIAAYACFQALSARWQRWIDPKSFGHRAPHALLNDLSIGVSMAVLLIPSAYWKQLKAAGWTSLSLGLVMGVVIVVALVLAISAQRVAPDATAGSNMKDEHRP